MSARARWLALGAVVLLGILPYVQTLAFGFTFDDAHSIEGHPGVQGPLSFAGIFLHDAWGRVRFDTIGIWRPLLTFTFWIDWHVGGGRPWPFHLTNLITYAALLVLFERFLARWCERELSHVGRFLAVAVFASLTIHADVVPGANTRAEILAALASLGAIHVATTSRRLGAREVIVAAILLFLALLSKESSTPVAVLLPILAQRAHTERGTARDGPMLALTVSSAASVGVIWGFRAIKMPFMDLGPSRALENPLLAVDASHRILGSFDVLALYLRHIVTGKDLVPDYSFSEPPVLRDGAFEIVLGAAFALACVCLLVRTWSRAPRVADAILGLGASYLVVSNLVTASSAIANRMVFFPSLWLVIVVALVVDGVVRAVRLRALAGAITMLFVLAQSAEAAAYASSWRDDVTLFAAATRVYPDVFRTQRNLAHALADDEKSEDAAYHLVLAEAIYAHYPAPVARDLIQPAWDTAPFQVRMAHVRDAFGPRATCDAATIAAKRLRSWGDARGASGLDDWTARDCKQP